MSLLFKILEVMMRPTLQPEFKIVNQMAFIGKRYLEIRLIGNIIFLVFRNLSVFQLDGKTGARNFPIRRKNTGRTGIQTLPSTTSIARVGGVRAAEDGSLRSRPKTDLHRAFYQQYLLV